MTCDWEQVAEGYRCRVCLTVRKSLVNRNCRGTLCPHLGPPISREGVTVLVKCGCTKKEHEQPHAAHKCSDPENKTGRCLPTLIPVDNEKWLARDEAKLYRCCRLCELNPANGKAG